LFFPFCGFVFSFINLSRVVRKLFILTKKKSKKKTNGGRKNYKRITTEKSVVVLLVKTFQKHEVVQLRFVCFLDE